MSPENKISNGSWNVGQYGYDNSATRKIFHNRLVVFIGDSVVRGMYKDFVKMISGTDRLLTPGDLKKKGESTFMGDDLVEGGVLDGLFNGKNYIEVREFKTKTHLVRFYFVTRIYYDYTQTILDDMKKEPIPDLILMGSACWDVTRYTDEIKHGARALSKYKGNLYRLFTSLEEILPPHTMCIWLCSMPIGSQVTGGFLPRAMQFKKEDLRQDILEANYFSSQIATDMKFDTIDLHYFFRNHQLSRERDGIHWNNTAHRNITYIILHHVIHGWKLNDKYKESSDFRVRIEPAGCQPPSSTRLRFTEKSSHPKYPKPAKVEPVAGHVNKMKSHGRAQRYEPYTRNHQDAHMISQTVGQPTPSFWPSHSNPHPYHTVPSMIPQYGFLDNSEFSYQTDLVRDMPYPDSAFRQNANRNYPAY